MACFPRVAAADRRAVASLTRVRALLRAANGGHQLTPRSASAKQLYGKPWTVSHTPVTGWPGSTHR